MPQKPETGLEDLYQDIDFAVLLQIAGRMIGQYVEQVARDTGLSAGHLSLLGMVHRKPGLSQKTYSTILAIDDATLARYVQKLAQHGLLLREGSEDDGRIVLLRLSREGEAFIRDVLDRLSGVRAQLQARLPEAELKRLQDSLVAFLTAEGPASETRDGQVETDLP